MRLPDAPPSQLAAEIAAYRAGGPEPDPHIPEPTQPRHRKCQLVCIVDDADGTGHWCERCPYRDE